MEFSYCHYVAMSEGRSAQGGRVVSPDELALLVREKCPGYDDEDDDFGELERIADQSMPTRILRRGPLTEDEKEDVIAGSDCCRRGSAGLAHEYLA